MTVNYHGFGNPLASRTQPDHLHPILIAFTGRLGSGKSTASAYIKEQYGGVKVGLAFGVKTECYDFLVDSSIATKELLLPADIKDAVAQTPRPKLVLPTDEEKVAWIDANKATLRIMLQWWGTDYRRSQDDQYWIKKALATIDGHISSGSNVITIDDMRFRNEAEALSDVGFNIVKLVVADDARIERVLVRDNVKIEPNDTHASESEIDSLSARYSIENSTELFAMKQQLDQIVLNILNKE